MWSYRLSASQGQMVIHVVVRTPAEIGKPGHSVNDFKCEDFYTVLTLGVFW